MEPLILKDRVLLREGKANGVYYPGKEIEKMVPELNAPPKENDPESRNKTSIFYDHDDGCETWLGEIKNFYWNDKERALKGDLYLVDQGVKEKIQYQIDNNLTRWAISPSLYINEKDHRASDIKTKSFSIVLNPAGGNELFLSQNDDIVQIEQEVFLDADAEVENIKVRCSGCGLSFVYGEQPEVSTGAVKCPDCKSVVNQEGKVLEKPADEIDVLSEEFKLDKETLLKFSSDQIEMLRNSSQILGKAENMEFSVPFRKVDGDKRIVFGIVAEPLKVDKQNDYLDETDIEEACHKYMENYRILSVMHRDKSGRLIPVEKDDELGTEKDYFWDELRIIENYIAPLDFIMENDVVRKGSWVLGLKVLSDEIWNKVKSGEITGFSYGGTGSRV